MNGDWLQDPDSLWHTTGLGREEFVQRLLSTLVFGHARHRWNVPGPPSERGRQYLSALAGKYFRELSLREAQFVDEFELPRRHDDERAGWPDQAAINQEALLLMELKTEQLSHRPGQLAHYLDLAVHHYPDSDVGLLYITPTMTVATPQPMPNGTHYAHTSWRDVAPLIADTWGDSPVDWQRQVAARLVWWLDQIEAQKPPPPRRRRATPVPHVTVESGIDVVLREAVTVQRTGHQAAVDLWPGSPDLLDELRLEVRARLRDGIVVDGTPITHVLPWVWSAGSSGGRPLSTSGQTHGYELRLSRYEKELW